MKPFRGIAVASLLAVGVLRAPLPLFAHDSPEHVIETLTARIEAVGRQPELLWERAIEYRALGQLKEARTDLKAALQARPDYVQAMVDLSRVELAQGSSRRSLATIRHALKFDLEPSTRAGLEMVHAEVLAQRGDLAGAVAACESALANAEIPDPEWYLTRSQYQYQLGRHAAAAAGLKDGFERIGNVVLEAEWIDALIDAGECSAALKRIEPLLAETRFQSTWRLRRGRALLGLGETTRAQSDLLAAITELNSRLGGRTPDVTLLAERGLAYALLGDQKLAHADLVRARNAAADPWVLFRLKRTLAEQR